MPQSKIEFRLGALHFVGEGDREWVTKQLDKIISQASTLIRVAAGSDEVAGTETFSPEKTTGNRTKRTGSPAVPSVSGIKSNASGKDLAAFIQSKKAGSNQRAKFLAAALWLHKHGKNNPGTRDVTNALKQAHVTALINPSQYLNQNIKQGYLKKSGNGFTITKKGETAF
jgi:hypothetical protein